LVRRASELFDSTPGALRRRAMRCLGIDQAHHIAWVDSPADYLQQLERILHEPLSTHKTAAVQAWLAERPRVTFVWVKSADEILAKAVRKRPAISESGR
jgi:hypothetical protein